MAFGDYATLLDDFNRTNETPVASPWSNKIVTSNGNMNLASNQLAGAGGSVNSAWHSTASPAADFEAYATVATVPADTNVVRIYGRIATPGTAGVDGYFLQITMVVSVADTWTLFRLDNASATSIGTADAVLTDGDKIGLECIGSAIKAYQYTGGAWTNIVSATDATYSAAGKVGLGCSNTRARLDDLYVGDVGASTARPKRLLTLGVG